jgi:SecD/SecF fusion protein
MLYFSRWKTALIWLSVLASVVFAAPNLFPKATLEKLPDWLPKTQMTLGLDLQGGSHILLQLDRKSLIDERVASIRDEIRSKLRDARVGYTGLSGSGKTIQVRIRDASQVDAAKKALADLTNPVQSGLFGGGSLT